MVLREMGMTCTAQGPWQRAIIAKQSKSFMDVGDAPLAFVHL